MKWSESGVSNAIVATKLENCAAASQNAMERARCYCCRLGAE
jgi:hypothetical protein